MLPIALVLSLMLSGEAQADPAAAMLGAPAPQAAAPEAAPTEPAAADPLPRGAPSDDYQFVAWCYGSLRGYLDLHDQVMPEVTRIESTYRKPGTKLSDDLKVYADMQKESVSQLKLFQRAITAAEKASLRPINAQGAEAVRKGRGVWAESANVPKARLAQEWMSWTLPDRCEKTARTLEQRATLMGASFRVNAEPAPAEPAATGEKAPATPN